ncbi:MAG: sulfite exporter TauE/SafE family protein [Candidatus Omnitrophica bacterium]|nr:sulfite exporter TauE/SafE family protein [Candidatus Omnitrophota bacterium]
MKNNNLKTHDWIGYANIALGLIVAIFALIAMFSSPTAKLQLPVPIPPSVAVDQPIWLLALIGFAIGCYGTIVGIGGGPLILPILVFFYGWENEFLVATSLFIVLLNAGSGCLGYAMQKRIDYKGGIKFTLAAMPGAFISSYIHHLVNLTFFNLIFGVFLIFLAGYTLVSMGRIDKTTEEKQKNLKEAKAQGFRRVRFIDNFKISYDFYANDKMGISMNLMLGFFCGFLGIGGGVFQVPILLFLLNYPTHIATATSHFVTLMTCAIAILPHVFLGNFMYGEAMWMGFGVIVGAQVGARLAAKLNTKVTLYLFIIILIVFAVKLFFV